MKMILSREEVRNIISCLSMEHIKMYSCGDYSKWNVEGSNDGAGLEIEYLFTEQGELKEKFVKHEKGDGGSDGTK